MENIEKKLHAKHEIKRLAKIVGTQVIEHYKQFVGKKIVNADGSLAKKYKPTLEKPEIKGYKDNYATLTQYLDTGSTTLWLCMKGCFKNDKHSCFYEEVYVYVGRIGLDNHFNSSGILMEVFDLPGNLDDTTTVEEQKELIKKRDELKIQIANIENQIWA